LGLFSTLFIFAGRMGWGMVAQAWLQDAESIVAGREVDLVLHFRLERTPGRDGY
jgi:hypothetical protein